MSAPPQPSKLQNVNKNKTFEIFSSGFYDCQQVYKPANNRMALKRKKVAAPLFYDVESNTLYPEELAPKKGKFDDVCRICATPATAFNELINIYGQDWKHLKLSAKIHKFLPISVDESDGLSHSICINCKDVLLKVDHLYQICQKTDAYFNGRVLSDCSIEPDEAEVLEVFDGEDTENIVTTYNCDINSPCNSEPDIIGFSLADEEPYAELPTSEHDVTDWIKEECVSEFSYTEDNQNSDESDHIEPTVTKTKNANPTITRVQQTVTVTKSGRQVRPAKKFGNDYNDDSNNQNLDINESVDSTEYIEPTNSKSVKSTTTCIKSVKQTATATKSGRQISPAKKFGNDSSAPKYSQNLDINQSVDSSEYIKPTKSKSVKTTTHGKSVKQTATVTKSGRQIRNDSSALKYYQNLDINESVDSTKYIKPINSKSAKSITNGKSVKQTVAVTKSGRQIRQVKEFENDSNDSSATEDEGNEESDDPDFIPEEEPLEHHSNVYNSVTALIPKQLPFKCDYCTQILRYKASIVSHYQTHGMHLCRKCFVHYETRDEVIQHFEEQHPGENKNTKSRHFPCDLCDDYCHSRKQLKVHLKEEHEKLMCYKCTFAFDTHHDLEQHLNSENHGNMCRICNIDFYSTEVWKWHAQQHYNYDTVKVVMPTEKENLEKSIDHTLNASGVPVEINEFVSSIKSQEKTREISLDLPSSSKKVTDIQRTFPFVCEYCGESLTNPTVAHDHYKKHDMQMCSYCFNNFPGMVELKEHQENKHTFSCALCPFKITGASANSLKNHLGTAHEDVYSKRKGGRYECGICDMRSKRKAELKSHMKEVHDKYICYTCLKCFNDENSYRAHLELEAHDFGCKVCGADFDQKRKMVHHVAFSHPDQISEHQEQNKPENPTYICLICNSVHHRLHFLKRHYLNLHKKFFCLLCNLVFNTHSEIDTHSLEVHGCNTSWSYRCSHCGKYFEAEENLTLHIKTVHEKIMRKHLCEQCGRSFRGESQLQEHVLRIHQQVVMKGFEKVECNICSKVLQAKSMEKHMKTVHMGNKVYLCVNCGKKLFTNSELEDHRKSNHKIEHVDDPGVECPHCRMKLTSMELQKHIEEEHTTEWTYICNYCNLYCNSDTEIWQHCTTEHCVTQDSNTQPFVRTSPHQCDTCLIYLANDFKLKMHKYVAHSNPEVPGTKQPVHSKKETKVACELCNEMIKKNYKYYHMYKAHNIPLKYPCSFCERSYNTEALRSTHVAKMHGEDRNVFCDLCQRAFKTKKRMRIHRKKFHFEDKQLPCPICSKKFKTYTSFKRHVKMHSAIMPFRCETCDRGFHTNSTFKNHMSRHENNLRIYQPWKKKVEIVLPVDVEPNISLDALHTQHT